MRRVIALALAWGFTVRERRSRLVHRLLRWTSPVWGAGIDLMASRAAGAAFTFLVSLCIAARPALRYSKSRRKNQLIRYFNSLCAARKRMLVRRMAYDHLLRSLKRYRRSLERRSGTDFSYLSAIALSIGGTCNLECSPCLMRPFQTPAFAAVRDLDYILAQADALDVSFVSVMGAGEPFLDSSYGMELLDCMKRHKDICFFVYTNGTTMTEALVTKAEQLDNLFIFVSVDGPENVHNRRRGAGTFRRVMETFRILRGSGVPYGYSAVAGHDNYREVTSPAFIETMAAAGALIGVYNQSCTIFDPKIETFTRDCEERREYFDRLESARRISPIYVTDLFELEEARYGCRAKKGTSCFIDAVSGRVSPCFLFPFSSEDSNLYAHRCGARLEEILKSDFFNHYRTERCERRLCIRNVRAELASLLENPCLSRNDAVTIRNLMEVTQ